MNLNTLTRDQLRDKLAVDTANHLHAGKSIKKLAPNSHKVVVFERASLTDNRHRVAMRYWEDATTFSWHEQSKNIYGVSVVRFVVDKIEDEHETGTELDFESVY